jgi:hypothetical protein
VQQKKIKDDFSEFLERSGDTSVPEFKHEKSIDQEKKEQIENKLKEVAEVSLNKDKVGKEQIIEGLQRDNVVSEIKRQSTKRATLL